ncbi:MAG: TolC family protein [Planctomycetes bacterium]|nr:TolC family protein [Planctomycetota bacterium]
MLRMLSVLLLAVLLPAAARDEDGTDTAPAGAAADSSTGTTGREPARSGEGSTNGAAPGEARAAGSELPFASDRLQWHIPDPEAERARVTTALEQSRRTDDKTAVTYQTRLLERLGTVRRAKQYHLSLEEALRRTLESNYSVQAERYNPAVATTRVVEAEAALDAVFFTNITKNKQDRPTGSQLQAGDLDFFESRYGVRKLLPTGMSVSGSYGLQRSKTTLRFQQINPEYFSDLQFEFRQPLLRGFGLDFNRSVILINKNDRRISNHAFERKVRDTLRNAEEVYWRLVEARRNVVITARVLADFEQIYDYLVARQAFDVTPVQISATKANLEQSRAEFIRVRAAVMDAEDRLAAIMNDPQVNLAEDVEIIPDDFPSLQRLVVDPLAEVQVALDHRSELKEQELRIETAKIAAGRAKNAELPRFDVVFRYTIDGLAGTADRSFDEVTRHNYVDYLVGVEFELPIGNRGPRAAHKRAILQHHQAVAALKALFEEVILDVNLAVRALSTTYDQIAPGYESAEAREREVESIVARAERKDFIVLNSELSARQSLASARRALIGAMVDYNVALIDLERAKGTLLPYNNVVVPTDGD